MFPAISPRDNQPVATIAQAGAADVAAAVAAARAAVDEGPWGRTTRQGPRGGAPPDRRP